MVYGFSSKNPLLNSTGTSPLEPKPKEKTPKEKCEEKGWIWDETTKTCNSPKPKTEKPTEKPTEIKEGTGKKYFIGGEELSKEQYERVRSIIKGSSSGSGGQKITAEDRVIAKSLETTPEQRAIEEERQRIIEEEKPTRREIAPETIGLEEVPVIGPIATKILDLLPFKGRENTKPSPEELRTEALTQIEKEEIERGLTSNEEFGAWVETIPVLGSLASRYAGGLIETPSENAREVKSNILKEKRRISNIETNVKLGYLPVSVAREQLGDIENNVQRLESRLKMLVSNSAELKFNSDFINTIETEILMTREKIFQGKQNILTGQTNNPTEIQLLQQLELNKDSEE